jgi:hypothetical protein
MRFTTDAVRNRVTGMTITVHSLSGTKSLCFENVKSFEITPVGEKHHKLTWQHGREHMCVHVKTFALNEVVIMNHEAVAPIVEGSQDVRIDSHIYLAPRTFQSFVRTFRLQPQRSGKWWRFTQRIANSIHPERASLEQP